MSYADNFGFQWNRFERTQLHPQSSKMFWRLTGWNVQDLDGLDILEVGSGAGRFSRVILEETRANLFSIDISSAVDANRRNNADIAPQRFHLERSGLYDRPFGGKQFDKVFCRGVLQHTPDIPRSIQCLVECTKPGGEIVVDFYVRRPWTKIHAKYALRPFTRRMQHNRLLNLIERNIDWLMATHDLLSRVGLHFATRFLPVIDLLTLPELTREHRREWAILDTFDMFSPEYDQPQRTRDVIALFKSKGASVAHAEPGLVRAHR